MRDWKTLHTKAMYQASRLVSRLEDRQEIAQQAMLNYLEYEKRHGKRSSQTIEQAVIDACRALIGRTGTRSHAEGVNRNSYSISPIDGEKNEFELVSREDEDDSRTFEGYGISLERFVVKLSSVERCIFKLHMEEEWDEIKIAYFFGVSPSRVSQRLKRIQSSLRTYAAREQSRSEKEESGIVEEILCKKNEGNEWSLDEFTMFRMEDEKSFEVESFDDSFD